jgi:hypothetical protein
MLKGKRKIPYVLLCAMMVFFACSTWVVHVHAADEEETIAGTVVKTDKGIIIEADDGDYLVKGQDLSKMVGKMVEVTGIITESPKGDVIEVKSYEEIQE